MNWLEMLGWTDENLDDLRFVGYAYIREGKYDIALDFFRAINLLSPNSNFDLQTLGAIYLQKGQSIEALNFLDKSIKIDPTHFPTLLNRSKALFSLGYKKQGLIQASALIKCKQRNVAKQAQALIAAYQ
jgi:tetratricopeptide (TPR) repeat protein